MISSCQSIESRSSCIPNVLNGTNFLNWKSEIESYLKSVNSEFWDIVINGYDMVDKNDIGFNSRSTHILYLYLDDDQYSLISYCLTSQEVWETLNALYEEKTTTQNPRM